jgi:hypothetical protein
MPVIPAIQEAEIRRIAVQGQPGQKVSKTLNQQNAGHGGTCLSSQQWLSRPTLSKNTRPYLKNNKAKRVEGGAV